YAFIFFYRYLCISEYSDRMIERMEQHFSCLTFNVRTQRVKERIGHASYDYKRDMRFDLFVQFNCMQLSFHYYSS
ncbi:hypothetical protein RDWZM_005132, partial [Blomia tropicalis]